MTAQEHSHEDPEVEAVAVVPDLDAPATLKRCGIYYIWGEITSGGLKDIHQDVLLKHYLGPKKYNSPIQLIINSEGGVSDEASALIDLLANVRFNVATAGFGTCASAGAMLLACGTKGLRTIAPNATVMIHRFSWMAVGSHQDLVAHRHAQDLEHDRDVDFWIRHSKYQTKRDIEKHLLRKEDTWLSAKEALRHGVVDRISGVLR